MTLHFLAQLLLLLPSFALAGLLLNASRSPARDGSEESPAR